MRPINYAKLVVAKNQKSVLEDQVFIDEKSQTFAVIDGVSSNMGALATDFIIKSLEKIRPQIINFMPQEMLELVNEQLLEENQKRQTFIAPQKPLMASIAIARISEGYLHYSSLGDSRVMLFRAGKLTAITKDHTLLQEEIDKAYDEFGEDIILTSPLRHVLTRALGQINEDYPFGKTKIYDSDILLMCSDGLTHTVLNSKTEKTITKHCMESINQKCEKIVNELQENAKNANDDLSLIVIAL